MRFQKYFKTNLVLLIVFSVIFGLVAYKFIHTGKEAHKRRFVYFDLGANKGDSIHKFFDSDIFESRTAGGDLMAKNFGPKTLQTRWEVHAFEPNPRFTSQLKATKAIYGLNHTINLYTETAAWIYDGTIDFFLSDIYTNAPGSSLNKDAPDVVNSGQKKILVYCKDISRILASYSMDDFIVMKLDVEGAEYDLLLDFFKKDVVKLVDFFAIEFHKKLTSLKNPEDTFVAVFKSMGIKYLNWI